MPEQRETNFYESGRATAPPGVCYTSLAGPTSEGYTHTVATTPVSTNLIDQSHTTTIQSPRYTPSYSNFIHQKVQASPCYTPNYSPCPSPSLSYSSTISKSNTSLPIQSPQYTPNYNSSPHSYSPTFSASSNYSSCTNSNSDNNFEYPSTSKNSPKHQQNSYLNQENTAFSSDQHSSGLFNYSKITKTDSSSAPKYTPNYSNFSYFSNCQPKYSHNKESVDLCAEKNLRLKKDCDVIQKTQKVLKDDSESNYNFGELQQFLSKHGTKIKSTSEASQDLVADSLLHFLQKKTQEKNLQDSFSYDLGDISQILVSLTSKYKSEEVSGLKKKESSEDPKLMNDFFTKIILDKEEKRLKTFDDKKKITRKEIFDDLNYDLEEKKVKRDAMSHYQEDKSHHKRSSNYGDFNQWDYLSQQDIQTPNSHNRRGHFPFGGTSQAHSVGWNPMSMSMPRSASPYYSNPHGHVMPAHAHAHTDYRYNQWNNPNHKNVLNTHNAHSQNTVLPQNKMDIKHHADIPNSMQEFGLSVTPNSDFSKLRTSSGDSMIRTPSEKSNRPVTHSDHLPSVSPAIRNTSTLRTPSAPNHPKTVINKTLSDLQMLVTNQKNENPPQKPGENYQQESVDLSAHSDVSKQKDNSVGEEGNVTNISNSDKREFRSPVSVIQTQSKQIDSEVIEKPVELTSKSIEKSGETDISSSISANNVESKNVTVSSVLENKQDNIEKEVFENLKKIEETSKPSVIVEKDGDKSVVNSKNSEFIPKNTEVNEKVTEKGEEMEREKEKEEEKSSAAIETNSSNELKEVTELTNNEESQQEESQKTKDSGELLLATCKEGEENSENLENGKRKAVDELSDPEEKKAYLEVESQLEKMFEGIGDDNSDLPTVSSTSAEVKPSSSETSKKPPSKKKPSRKSRAVRLSSGQSSGSEYQAHGKKYKTSLPKDDTKKKMKKPLCDVMDRRGPFLHVEGSKESPMSVIVINFPKGDDEDEKDKSSTKKQTSNVTRAKHHNELDFRGRSRNGLFSSTLSARYDAHTTDHSWICVFCKKGPHYNTLGDLFGPYIISKDESSSLCDFSGDEKDISDAQKRGGRNKRSLRSNNMVEHFQKMSKKLRRTQSNESCLVGMTVISDDQVDQLRYEVWVHEQCAVWSSNVCLIGSRIVGMQEAIWSSVKTMCSKCGAFGANIGCVYRNCPNRSHYHCAKESGWSLEQDTFISTCHVHKPRS